MCSQGVRAQRLMPSCAIGKHERDLAWAGTLAHYFVQEGWSRPHGPVQGVFSEGVLGERFSKLSPCKVTHGARIPCSHPPGPMYLPLWAAQGPAQLVSSLLEDDKH